MKARRLVSLVLAVMMVLTMLPISAMAKEFVPTGGNPIVDVQLSVSDKFAGTVFGTEVTSPEEYGYTDNPPELYAKAADILTVKNKKTGWETLKSKAETQLSKNITEAGKPFTVGTDAMEVSKGQTIYVGVKVKGELEGTEYKGIYSSSFYLGYNADQVTPDTTAVVTNKAVSGEVFGGNVNDETKAFNGGLSSAYGSFSLTDPGTSGVTSVYKDDGTEEATTIKNCLALVYVNGATKHYLPQSNTWDFVIPFTVSDTDKVKSGDTIKIEVLQKFKDSANQPTEFAFGFSTQEPGSTTVSDHGTQLAVDPSHNADHLKANVVTLTVASNEPMVKVATGSAKVGKTTTNVTKRMIDLELVNAFVPATALKADSKELSDTTGWAVTGTSNSGAVVEKVEVTDTAASLTPVGGTAEQGHQKVRVTVSNIGTVANDDLKVSIPQAALKATKGSLSGALATADDAKIDVVDVPAVTFGYNNNTLTGLAADADSFRLAGETAWTDVTTANSATVGNLTTKLNDLIAAANNTGIAAAEMPAIQVVKTADKAYTDVAEIVKVKQAGKPTVAIDYVNEKAVKAMADDTATDYAADEVESGFAADATTAPSYTKLTTAGGIDLTVDTIQTANTPVLWVRAAGDGSSKIASLPVTTTIPARPAKPTISASATQSDASKIAGSTDVDVTLAGSQTTVSYWVNTTPNDTDIASATPSTLTPTSGKGTIAKATTADTIHAFYPASNTAKAFHSAVEHVTGQGNDFGTVETEAEAEGDTITLTMKGGDTWVDDLTGVTGWAITNGNDTDATSAQITAELSGDDKIVLTLKKGDGSKYSLKDTAYTITVPAGAHTNGSKTLNGTAGVKVTPSSNGYRLEAGSSKHNGGAAGSSAFTFTAKGGLQDEAVHTVNYSGLADYEDLTAEDITITPSKGTATGTISELTPGASGTGSFKWTAPDGTVNEKITLTITVDTGIKQKTLTKAVFGTTLDTNLTKTYDGTTNVAAGLTSPLAVDATSGELYSAKKTIKIAFTGASYDSETVNTAPAKKTITLTGVKIVGTDGETVEGTDAEYYTLGDGVTTLTLDGNITAATYGGATVDDSNASTSAPSQDALVDAIKKLPVSLKAGSTEVPEGTLSEVFTEADADAWKGLADAAVLAGKHYAAGNDDLDLSDSGNMPTTATVQIGHKIVAKLASGDEIKSITGTGYTLESDGTITVGETASTPLQIVIKHPDDADGNPVADTTVNLTVTVNPAEPDYDAAASAGTPVTVTIPGDQIATWMNADIKANYNLGTLATPANDITCDVKINQSFTPTPSGGFGVTLETQGYGSVSSAYIQADSEGKILELPEVTNVVKGAYFKGWSTEKGNPKKIIDVDTFKVDAETTLYAVYEGYVVGTDKGLFEPKRNVTRAELAKMLVVATGNYDPEKDYGTPSFPDAKGAWYTPFIAAAEDAGFFSGDQGKARPTDPITRNEAASMIARAFNINVTTGGTTSDISDFANVPDWAKDVVAALCNNGTINGREDGQFHGVDNIQRSEVTQMVNKNLISDSDKAEIAKDTTVKSPFADVQNKADWYYTNVLFASLSVPASYYSTAFVTPTK